MEQHFTLTDSEFEKQFEACTLNPELFSHEAHLRLAWIHIFKYGELKAIKNITEQLQNYVAQLGVADKYNHTLTVASIKTVWHFMQKKNVESFDEFISKYPRLKNNFKDLLDQHYSFDLLNAKHAKDNYLAPDLLEFN